MPAQPRKHLRGWADVIGTERAGFEPAEAFTSLVFKTANSGTMAQ